VENFRSELFLVALVAALAPLIAEIPRHFRVPVVILELVLGIVIGPHVLGVAVPDGLVGTMGELGLTFLLFMVGMEVEPGALRGKPLTLAAGGWLLSFAVALLSMYALQAIGLIQAPPMMEAVALSTTALGILAPVLRDEGILDTDFGKLVLSAATMAEFGPLIVISLLVLPTHSFGVHTLLMLGFVAIALLTAWMTTRMRSAKWLEVLSRTMQSSGQLPVRLCILLQALLVLLAAKFGLNVVMGAFAAGMVVGMASKGEGGVVLRQKLDAIGYGFLIPFFFIVVGMKFNVGALFASPLVPLQVVALLALMVLIRAVPVFLYKQDLAAQDRVPFALYSSTSLTLIVVITEIGVSSGLMGSDHAAVLVSVGMISVLAFPILAGKIRHQH
jgi:Kef-type K+ transport system membrane component KefB